MTIITLMTDFGLKDGNVGVMKGVITAIAPRVQIIDLSHLISPQNIAEAALILSRSAPYFPPGTIHLGVVDPGVGTRRRPMAARINSQFYVGPDNGTPSLLFDRLVSRGESIECIHLTQSQFWLQPVSHVFHGRDIFAPVAAHLANGMPLSAFGEPFQDPLRLDLPQPHRTPDGWSGQIIHIDHFGNLSTNLGIEQQGMHQNLSVIFKGAAIDGLVKTFGERPPGTLVALFGSTGSLIISVVHGSASQRLEARLGEPVEIILRDKGG
jgi:hypothetical protein